MQQSNNEEFEVFQRQLWINYNEESYNLLQFDEIYNKLARIYHEKYM